MDRNLGSEEDHYYRSGFRTMSRLVNIQLLIILALVFTLAFYVNKKEDRNRYFAETSEGKRMQMVALPLPNMGKAALANWASLAASQIMTFGFNDIDERFALSRANFTQQGWENFRKAMTASGLIDDVIKAQQIVTSVPEDPPILLQEGLVNGKYRWVFDTPLLITFRSGGVKTSRDKTVHMVLERIPTRDNPNGVGIAEWYIR